MKLEGQFQGLKARRQGALMPHVYYGDPNEAFSLKLIETLATNGADLIELGIPFSDPTADGPTFQAACDRALNNSMTPARCIQGIRTLRNRGLEVPMVVTTYYNIPYSVGVGAFVASIKEAGAQAMLVPDLPLEEASDLLREGKKRGIHVILQIAPTTTEDRLKEIANIASGFLYVIGIEGVTGARDRVAAATVKLLNRSRRYTEVPLMAGFGISKGDHAAAVVSAGADGVVAGSVFANRYEKNLRKPEETLPEIAHLTRAIKQGCIDGYLQRTRITK